MGSLVSMKSLKKACLCVWMDCVGLLGSYRKTMETGMVPADMYSCLAPLLITYTHHKGQRGIALGP